jgi:hypothetical protein
VIVERIRAASAAVVEALAGLKTMAADADTFEAKEALVRARAALLVAELAMVRNDKKEEQVA